MNHESKPYWERVQDALVGPARADGSRIRSFGVHPETKDGAYTGRTVYVTEYDNGETERLVVSVGK